jgi:hypothetical protein
MSPSIHLSFKYVKDDVVSALRAHYRSRLRLPLDISVTALLIFLGCYFWRSSDSHWLGVLFVTVATTFAIILISVFGLVPIIIFRREPKYRDEYSLDFSSEGIHFSTANIDSRLEWGLYTNVLVTNESYILYYGDSALTVIPKRVFDSTEQQNQFDELVAVNIPKIVRK